MISKLFIERAKAELAYYEFEIYILNEIYAYSLNPDLLIKIEYCNQQIEGLKAIITIHKSTCLEMLNYFGEPFYKWFTQTYMNWVNSETSFKVVPKSYVNGIQYNEIIVEDDRYYLHGNLTDGKSKIVRLKFCRYLYQTQEHLIAMNEQNNMIRVVSRGDITSIDNQNWY